MPQPRLELVKQLVRQYILVEPAEALPLLRLRCEQTSVSSGDILGARYRNHNSSLSGV